MNTLQHHLSPAIPKEVAQQPRRELGRGELEGDHGQTEDEAMTVTTVLLTVMSSARASSAVPWKASRSRIEPGPR